MRLQLEWCKLIKGCPPLTKKLGNVERNTGRGFHGGSVVTNPPANAGDTGSSPAPPILEDPTCGGAT